MAYRVDKPDGIRLLFSGRFFPRGSAIGPHIMPPRLWEALINEGAIVPDDPNQPQAIPQPDNPLEYAAKIPDLSDVISPELIPALADVGVHSMDDLARIPESDLTKIKGVGPARVKKWKESAK